MGIFKEENGKIIVDPEIKLLSEIKFILDRDKSEDKRQAMNELKFVYFYIDYRSPYMKHSKDDRIAKVGKECRFPDTWKPDKALQAAIECYDNFQQTASIIALTAIRESLLTSTKVIETVRSHIETQLTDFNRQGPGDDPNTTTDVDLVTNIVTSLTQLLVIAAKLPSVINTLKDLEESVKKEQSDSRKIRGGGTVNQFED